MSDEFLPAKLEVKFFVNGKLRGKVVVTDELGTKVGQWKLSQYNTYEVAYFSGWVLVPDASGYRYSLHLERPDEKVRRQVAATKSKELRKGRALPLKYHTCGYCKAYVRDKGSGAMTCASGVRSPALVGDATWDCVQQDLNEEKIELEILEGAFRLLYADGVAEGTVIIEEDKEGVEFVKQVKEETFEIMDASTEETDDKAQG